MPKCRMCSQEVHVRGSICQECEWEAESARAWAEAQEARDVAAHANGGGSNASPVAAGDAGDAATHPLPQPGAANLPEILHGASETSYNLWRTKRGVALLLAIMVSAALAGFSALAPADHRVLTDRSVAASGPGMLRPCGNAVPATSCLQSPPH